MVGQRGGGAWRRSLGVMAGSAAVVMVVAACGGSSDSQETESGGDDSAATLDNEHLVARVTLAHHDFARPKSPLIHAICKTG